MLMLWLGALTIVLITFQSSRAEACGGFYMKDLESGENLSFDHSMVRFTRINHNAKSITVSIQGYGRKVPLYAPYLNYDLLAGPGSSQNIKTTYSDCPGCWSLEEVRRNLKLSRRQATPAIWFEDGRTRLHGRLIGTWSADEMILGTEKYSVEFGKAHRFGSYEELVVKRGTKAVLQSSKWVDDVCGAAKGEGKGQPTQLSYRKAIWRRVALYLIAKHVANTPS